MTLHRVIVRDVQVQLYLELQLEINVQKNTKYDFCLVFFLFHTLHKYIDI